MDAESCVGLDGLEGKAAVEPGTDPGDYPGYVGTCHRKANNVPAPKRQLPSVSTWSRCIGESRQGFLLLKEVEERGSGRKPIKMAATVVDAPNGQKANPVIKLHLIIPSHLINIFPTQAFHFSSPLSSSREQTRSHRLFIPEYII